MKRISSLFNKIMNSPHIKHYHALNNSKLLSGLGLIVLNLFSKYIEINLSKTQEQYIRNSIGREILIFTILYIGTKDIFFSILLTAAFIILSNTVFNESSRFCLMSKAHIECYKDLDAKSHITEKQIQEANDIIYKANIQKYKLETANSNTQKI